MSEFLFLFKGGIPDNPDIAPDAARAQMEKWNKWTQELISQGRYIGGDRLHDERKTVMSKMMVTDGPYAEGKEIVGGYMMIKADNMAEAVEISRNCPIFDFNGVVEVREILRMEM